MKKYRICLFLFLGVSVICILIAFFVRRSQEGAGLENRNETGIEQLETEMEDLAGVRIICQFEEDIDTVAAIIRKRGSDGGKPGAGTGASCPGRVLSGGGGWDASDLFKGSENNLSLYTYAAHGFSTKGADKAARRDLVFVYGRSVSLSGIVY